MKKFCGFLALFGLLSACKATTDSAQGSKVVHLATWSEYVTDEDIKKFEEQTGYRLAVSNYSSNEELLAKLQAGATGYDVAVPSDYMVDAMVKLQLVEPLDLRKVPHAQELDPNLMKRYFDKENAYSLPFSWGTTGIAVNKRLYEKSIQGWSDVFGNKALEGKISLLDDPREAIGAALKKNGKSLNTKDAKDLAEAKALLLQNKQFLKSFNSDPLTDLVNNELAVAQVYSTDALLAGKRTGGAVIYVVPAEGCTLWIDNLVIPKGGRNREGAYAVINFLLSKDAELRRAKRNFLAPSHRGAREDLPPELKSNKMMFPESSVLSRCEMMEALGEDLVSWDRVWTELKATF